MSVRAAKKVILIALVLGALGIAGLSHAETGTFRITIPGAFAAPTGTSGDGQVTLRIGVGLPVFEVSPTGVVGGGSIATATFAQWSDTVLTTDFLQQSTLMVFRLAGGFMAIAAGVATPNGLATSFSATAPFQSLTGAWDVTTGPTPNDALVTFTYDTNSHIKENGLVRFVAGNALASVVTKTIPALATVDALRNITVFDVTNNAKAASLGDMIGHSAYAIAGHGSEFVDVRAIHLRAASLYLVYGCASPSPGSSSVACLIGGTGFATHLSGTVGQVAGSVRKATIAGVVDADLVLELNLSAP
jgi:hypothetical protein